MDFRDLLSSGKDNVLDMTEKYRMEQKRKEMEESEEEGFIFEDFDGCTALDENFEKQERNSGGFDLLEYGLPIVNGHHGFSYNYSYRIPYERYLEVFGPSVTFHVYLQHSMGAWGGNCFGMAAVSILTSLKKINLGDYQKEGVPLADTAYDHIVSEDCGSYCCLEQDSELTKLIERYYLLQFSIHALELRRQAAPITRKEPERLQSFYYSVYRDRIPYMVTVFWETAGQREGHAMVVDSIRTPENLGNGWHRVYLYDPNNPCHTFSGQMPALYYRQAKSRYIDINVDTGEWHMNVIVNADGDVRSGEDYIGSDTANASISFINCESLQNNFLEKARMHPSFGGSVQMLSYRTACVEVADPEGNRLCRVVNGVMTDCADERICNLPVIGAKADGGQRECCGTLLLPEISVTVKMDKGFAGMFSADQYLGCVSEKPLLLCFGEDGSMELSSEIPALVNVVVKSGESEHFVSYMTDINVSEEPCRVALQGRSLSVNTDNNQKINVEIITETGWSEEKNVTAGNGALIKGRDNSRPRKRHDTEVSK